MFREGGQPTDKSWHAVTTAPLTHRPDRSDNAIETPGTSPSS